MKAVIFAAGRGERMRPLTDSCPKPLLEVGTKPLIVWHIERLKAAGITELVINTAHLGQVLVDRLGDGSEWGVRIQYSREEHSPWAAALETAGGIAYASDLIGKDPFIAISGDVYCEIDLKTVVDKAGELKSNHAWCLMVPNPEHHPQGDFVLDGERLRESANNSDNFSESTLTFSGISAYHPQFFSSLQPVQGPSKLSLLLRSAMRDGRVSGSLYTGLWWDVGTVDRLHELDLLLRHRHTHSS